VVSSSLLFPSYAKVVDEIIALDSDDTAGLKSAYEKKRKDFSLRAEVAAIEQAVAQAVQSGGDVPAALAKLETVLAKTGGSGAAAQKLYLIKAQVTFSQSEGKDVKTAVELLEKAVAADPKSDMGRQLTGVVKQLREQLSGEGEGSK